MRKAEPSQSFRCGFRRDGSVLLWLSLIAVLAFGLVQLVREQAREHSTPIVADDPESIDQLPASDPPSDWCGFAPGGFASSTEPNAPAAR